MVITGIGRRARARGMPMLTEIGLENFKGFKKTGFLPLKPLTLLVGSNSSGKSSVLKALGTFSQTAQSSRQKTSRILNTRGEIVDIGVYDEIANHGNKSFSLSFCLQFDSHPLYNDIKDKYVTYKFGRARNGIDVILKKIELGELKDRAGNYQANPLAIKKRSTLVLERNIVMKKWKVTKFSAIKDEEISEIDRMIFGILADRDHANIRPSIPKSLAKKIRIEDLELRITECMVIDAGIGLRTDKLISEYKQSKAFNRIKDPQKRKEALIEHRRKLIKGMLDIYQDKLAPQTKITRALNTIMSDITYIGPLREEPNRQLKINSGLSMVVGKAGEHTAQLLHDADAETKALLKRSVQKMKLGKNVGTESFESKLGSSGFIQIYLEEDDGNKRVLADVGFGVSQVLPIVLQCCISSESNILLEQPELHLHPGLQTELGDLFIDSIKRGNQIIAETHSVNMIERIRRRIREGVLDPADVSIIYFRKKSGTSVPFPIGLDQDGDFTRPWPDDDGFFGEREKEQFSDFFDDSDKKRSKPFFG